MHIQKTIISVLR